MYVKGMMFCMVSSAVGYESLYFFELLCSLALPGGFCRQDAVTRNVLVLPLLQQ